MYTLLLLQCLTIQGCLSTSSKKFAQVNYVSQQADLESTLPLHEFLYYHSYRTSAEQAQSS
jgi:hypothetical protein